MKSTIIPFITVLFSVLLFTSCAKEATTSIVEMPVEQAVAKNRNNSPAVQEYQSYIQEEMAKQHLPALSVLIFEEDEVLYESCFGKASIQENKALQKEDVFLLASVSKVITATALLQLFEQNKFSLDDYINDYLSFKVVHPNYNTPITFRMLLTHTAAIADGPALDDQYYYGKDSPVELGDYLENYLTSKGNLYDRVENFHDFRPGTDYEYSNTGNALIGLLVTEISEMDFNDYCQQNIFNPLGMTHTAWHLSDIKQFIVQPYDYTNGNYKAVEHYTFTDYPNGGLRSNAGDLFKFLQAFVQEGKSQEYQLLKPATIKAMTTLQIPNITDDMGLHLFQMDEQENLWGHDGGEQGVATIMAFNQETKMGAIILTNQGEAELDDLLIESYLLGFEL